MSIALLLIFILPAIGTCLWYSRKLKFALKEANESREFLKQILNRLPVALFCKDADADFTFSFWNQRSEELFGLKEKDVRGKSDYDFFTKEQADFFRAKDIETMKSSTEVAIDVEPVNTASGERRLLSTRKVPISLFEGQRKFLLGITEDITDRKATEDRLKRSEEQFRRITMNVPGMLFQMRYSLDGDIWFDYASEGTHEIFGITNDEMIRDPRKFLLSILPEDRHQLEEILKYSRLRFSAIQWEGKILDPIGTTKWIRLEARSWEDESGDTVWDGIVSDITPRKSAEEAARLYEQIVRDMNLGIYIYHLEDESDPESLRLVYANSSAEQFTGIHSTKVVGKRILEAWPNLTTLNDFYQVVLKNESKDLGRIDYELPIPHGLQNFFVRCFAIPGRRVAVMFENITERVRTQNQVEIERTKAIAASKMATLGEMSGGIAHEINNPLAIIHGKAAQLHDLLMREELDRDLLLKNVKKIEDTALRISRIIKGLRAFSRNADQDPVVSTEIRSIIEDTLELCGERFKTHGVELRVPSVPDLTFECRGVQLSQILLNLLNNAYDAVLALSSDRHWVELDVIKTDNSVRITVTDGGSGIPEGLRDRLFEPFFTTKEVGKGTGLGLPIAKGIVEEHHGTLTLDTRCPNTRFVIELPLQQPGRSNA